MLRKSLTQDGEALVVAVEATAALTHQMQILKPWPPAMIHLGQAMLGALLLHALPDHKGDDKLELQWQCQGPFGRLVVDALGPGQIRGTIFQPRPPEVQDLKTGLGPGLLQVRRVRKQPVTGIVEARGEVPLDLLEYLEKSEQKNCAMNLWVDLAWDDHSDPESPFQVRRALGYLVHVLPQKNQAATDAALFRWDRHIQSLGPLSKWVMGADPTADMLSFITAEFTPRILEECPTEFHCTCTEERAARALALLERQERREGKEPEAQAELRCEFCGRLYRLNSEGA